MTRGSRTVELQSGRLPGPTKDGVPETDTTKEMDLTERRWRRTDTGGVVGQESNHQGGGGLRAGLGRGKFV